MGFDKCIHINLNTTTTPPQSRYRTFPVSEIVPSGPLRSTPPLPSPHWSNFNCLWILLLALGLHINGLIEYKYSLFLASFTVFSCYVWFFDVHSRYGVYSFLLLNSVWLYEYKIIFYSLPSCTFDLFPVSAITTKATMNTLIQIVLQTYAFISLG